jgi:Fic family protein
MEEETLNFLRESNNIEDEWDDLSLQDSILAWEYISKQKTLTPENIKKTHKLLMRSRDTIDDAWKGIYRIQDIWIGQEMRTWQGIPENMDRWMTRVNEFVLLQSGEGYEDIIKRDHIAYEHIHPFLDGNGRSGRLFFLWQSIKLGLPIKIFYEKDKYEYYKWFRK